MPRICAAERVQRTACTGKGRLQYLLITLLFGIAIAASTDFREYVFEIFGLFFSPKIKTIIIEEIISKFAKIPRAKDGASNALGIAMS